jgi:hypothetical protein
MVVSSQLAMSETHNKIRAATSVSPSMVSYIKAIQYCGPQHHADGQQCQ